MNYRKVEKLVAVSVETGERYAVLIAPLQRHWGGKFVKLFQSELDDILLRRVRLRGETLRVLFHLLGKVGYQNTVPLYSVVASNLSMKKPNVFRAYKQLLDAGILLYGTGEHRVGYRLSPLICWKGTGKQLEQAIGELLAAPVKALRETTNPSNLSLRELKRESELKKLIREKD